MRQLQCRLMLMILAGISRVRVAHTSRLFPAHDGFCSAARRHFRPRRASFKIFVCLAFAVL